jgi:hypothetical protein
VNYGRVMELELQPEWLGPFKGSELSFLECEILGLTKVDPVLMASQWQTQDTIWFDYVRLHPVKALYYFAHVYGDTFGRYLGENIEYSMRFGRGLKGDVLEHRELRSLAALKREADKRGIPYDIWLSRLFKHFGANGWTRPPRPAHMVKSEEAIEGAAQYWAETCCDRTIYAKDPWFQTDEWVGHAQQQRYERWIVTAVGMRERKELALSSALYDKSALRIEAAAVTFPELINEAQLWRLRK